MPLRIVVDADLFEGGKLGRGCAMGELERLARTLERNQGDILHRLRTPCSRRRRKQQRQAHRNDRQKNAQEAAKIKHLVGSLGSERRLLNYRRKDRFARASPFSAI